MLLSKLQSRHAPAETRKFSHVEIAIAPTAVASEPEHSTDPPVCDYAVLKRKPRNSWTLDQRRALCVLRRWYDNSWTDLAQVFNSHFAADAPAESSSIDLSGSTLEAQLCNMQIFGRKREAFVSVFIETLFVDEFGAWANMRRELEQTAERVGLELRRRLCENREEMLQKCSPASKSTKRKKIICGIDSVLGNMAYESEGSESHQESPAKRLQYLTPSPSPQKGYKTMTHVSEGQYDSVAKRDEHHNRLPATPQSLRKSSRIEPPPQHIVVQKEVYTGPRIDQLPQLVFRFYNNESSGMNGPASMRAGLFQDSRAKVASPPEIDSEVFRKEAAKHFSWTREPTPFISMYESFLPVLHRALLSTTEASIAVIDLHAVSRSQERNRSKIYVAALIVKRLGLTPEIFGYRARSEWLVWGMIEKDAIVATFKIEHLRKFLAGSPDVSIVLRFPAIESSRNAEEYREKLKGNANQVSRASGRVVGKYLAFTGIPPSYIEYTARKIARDWQLHGSMSVPRLRKYLDGVQLGLLQKREDIMTSTQAKKKPRLIEYLQRVDSGLLHEGVDVVLLDQARPKPRLEKYLRQVDAGLQRKQAGLVPFKKPRSKPQMTRYLQQIDSSLQRKASDDRPANQAPPKRPLSYYLQQVDSGLQETGAALITPTRRRSKIPLAKYLERVDLGQAHAEGASTKETGASSLGLTCDEFLSRRRL